MSTIALLTRGDETWGTGHLYRTSWLAPILAAQPGIKRAEVFCLESPVAREFWPARGYRVNWLEAVTGGKYLAARLAQHQTVVIDWLNSPAELVSSLRAAGCKVVLLDDYGPARVEADIVVNALLSELANEQRRQGHAEIYSGADYVQLPPEVTRLRGVADATTRAMATELSGGLPEPGEVHAVMVSFGGRPQPGLYRAVLDGLRQAGYGGRVLVMPAAEPVAVPAGLDVESKPAGAEFHDLLSACDVVVCGGGLTLYEAAFLGIPALAAAVRSTTPGLEDHQLGTITKLATAGCCQSLGWAHELSPTAVAEQFAALAKEPAARAKLSTAGRGLFDGRGLQRTAELVLDCAGV
ncbi:hypothetical protein JW859_01035 [bacterium]|nr:hypothetical protein [bacterium]